GNSDSLTNLRGNARFKVRWQAGGLKNGRLVPRLELADAPMMPAMIEGRTKDPIAAKGFEYWMTIHTGPDKWLALPPGTPEPLVAAYREAYRRVLSDPKFIERSRKVTDDFTPVPHDEVEAWM